MIEPNVRHWSSTALHLRGILVAKRISELAQQGERELTRLRARVCEPAARLAAPGALSTPGNL
jgi:hypothetical protein